MAIGPPKSLTSLPLGGAARPTGAEVLEMEMRGEQAAMLGLSAKRMECALAEFANSNGDPRRTQVAADAVHSFFIQREMVGLDNHDYAIEFYKIPGAVLAGVGVKPLLP